MTVAEILDLISRGGILAAAVLVIWAFVTERIVPAGRLEDLQKLFRENQEAARLAMAESLRTIKEFKQEMRDRLDRASTERLDVERRLEDHVDEILDAVRAEARRGRAR